MVYRHIGLGALALYILLRYVALYLRLWYVALYQSQNRKGREILPSLSYHSNENNSQMEDDILKSVTYGGTDA